MAIRELYISPVGSIEDFQIAFQSIILGHKISSGCTIGTGFALTILDSTPVNHERVLPLHKRVEMLTICFTQGREVIRIIINCTMIVTMSAVRSTNCVQPLVTN